VLGAIDIASTAILVVMMLVLGNTIAMNTRERTSEHGVMRALGFSPRHIAALVFGEALLVGTLGGVAGVGLAYALVQGAIADAVEESLGALFPY
ncbi:FtsX-like permease family protein, partial [Acinetobacter baumannii]|uniref:FtsX-like permease family protein n=1 Tax=Acinetobacter baumannii TaxID=470 RepID=UPI0037D79302